MFIGPMPKFSTSCGLASFAGDVPGLDVQAAAGGARRVLGNGVEQAAMKGDQRASAIRREALRPGGDQGARHPWRVREAGLGPQQVDRPGDERQRQRDPGQGSAAAMPQ
jgi:hypothetical protein